MATFFLFQIISSFKEIQWTRRINHKDMETRKNLLTQKKPIFVINKEAMKEIEMVTESIPQLILQTYIFQKQNDIFNVFSSLSILFELYKSAQIISIIISTFSIIFGLIGIYGYKAFYYYEQRMILLKQLKHPEKGLKQKIGRFISLFFWYFSIVISRILLIVLILSYNLYLLAPFILIILIKSLVLNYYEKKYFKQKKYEKEFEKETTDFRDLYFRENAYLFDIENLNFYKPKSVLKKVLALFYMIFGVYDNMFIYMEYHSDIFYIPRQTKNYIIFYLLFYIENLLFAIILYFGFNNNLRIIFFYVFTFPISVLIQILYRQVSLEEKVSLYLFLFMNTSNNNFYLE
jgi:hypothetical protein